MSATEPRGLFRWGLGFTLGAVVLLAMSVYFRWEASGYVKMAASTGFLATAIGAGAFHSTYGKAIFAGLIFSWWGDLFLISSVGNFFLLGLVSFLLAHLAFSAAFILHGVRLYWVLAGLALTTLVSLPIVCWLYPHLGGMRYPVLGYIVVISCMTSLAVGAQGRLANRWLLLGAVLFFVSDIFVARQRFVVSSLWNPLIGLPVYYAAQLLLARSIATTSNRWCDSD